MLGGDGRLSMLVVAGFVTSAGIRSWRVGKFLMRAQGLPIRVAKDCIHVEEGQTIRMGTRLCAAAPTHSIVWGGNGVSVRGGVISCGAVARYEGMEGWELTVRRSFWRRWTGMTVTWIYFNTLDERRRRGSPRLARKRERAKSRKLPKERQQEAIHRPRTLLVHRWELVFVQMAHARFSQHLAEKEESEEAMVA